MIADALGSLGVPKDMVSVNLEHPADMKFGDFSTNVAMLLFKQLGATVKSPIDLAEKISAQINSEDNNKKYIEKAEAVKPGFVNIFLSKSFLVDSVIEAKDKAVWYGKGNSLWNKKIIIEHTNLNAFKPFHIGHLINSTVGESLSRLMEFQDTKLVRASYGSDIGLPVAKAIWGMMSLKKEGKDLKLKCTVCIYLPVRMHT